LLDGAKQGGFDVVVAEALDRVSRDQEDIAAIYKRLTHANVRISSLWRKGRSASSISASRAR
jgi:DNA invertase Pin-like site-specific DNA recombinase